MKWTTFAAIGVAALSLIVSLVMWSRVSDLESRLDETSSVVAGLGVRSAIIDQALDAFSGPLAEQLDPVIAELDAFSTSVIAVPITIDQELPIDTTIDFARTIDVPINTEIPVNETIDTTVTVEGPLGVDVDLDVTVPIEVTFPIDLVVPITIDEQVPVRTTVPVQLSFPIEFEVAGTPLESLALSLRDGLGQLAGSLG